MRRAIHGSTMTPEPDLQRPWSDAAERRGVERKRVTIVAAIAANLAIAATKLVAAGIGNSAAMLSEGLHSIVDTGDGLLLLLGLHLSKRPPSERHPYGHGLDAYFWSLVVAMSIFGMGGGISIYEGILHVLHPAELDTPAWSYGVLGAAFLFEGTSWIISMRGFRAPRKRHGLWRAIERSKDPTTFIVVLEDSAALLGIVVAATGLGLARAFQQPVWDAIASIVVGLLLVSVALILGRETRSLLLGESADPELVDSIRRVARSQAGVLEAARPRTMHIGPDVVHVDLDVRIDASHSGRDVIETCKKIDAAVRAEHPSVRRVSLGFLG
jgi:cation diffusion facilitator family transporter